MMVLERIDAVRVWLELCGPDSPMRASKEAPESYVRRPAGWLSGHPPAHAVVSRSRLPLSWCRLRALYGTQLPRNAVHGSTSVAAAAAEMAFFFPTSGHGASGRPTRRRSTSSALPRALEHDEKPITPFPAFSAGCDSALSRTLSRDTWADAVDASAASGITIMQCVRCVPAATWAPLPGGLVTANSRACWFTSLRPLTLAHVQLAGLACC